MHENPSREFQTAAELFEHAFKDRDPTTGALKTPLTIAHVTGPFWQLVFELGQRMPAISFDRILVPALVTRLNIWGCSPALFGRVRARWGQPPDYRGITNRDAMMRWLQDMAGVAVYWPGVFGFKGGEAPAEAVERTWGWWRDKAEEVHRARDEELSLRLEPRDPAVRMIWDAVRPLWQDDKRPDPHAILAYRLLRWRSFFGDSPEAIERHFERSVYDMMAGLEVDRIFAKQRRKIERRMRASEDEVRNASYFALHRAGKRTADAMREGTEPRRLFGPTTVSDEGKVETHLDRDGLAGGDEVAKVIIRDRRAGKHNPVCEESDIEQIRGGASDAQEVMENREQLDALRQLRESFEVEGDREAVGFIDWKRGLFSSREAAAKAQDVTLKNLRDASERVKRRAQQLGIG